MFGTKLAIERGEPVGRLENAELGDLADMAPADLYRHRLRLETVASAGLARCRALELGQFVAQPGAVGFAPAPVEVGQHALEHFGRAVFARAVIIAELNTLLAGAIQDRSPHFFG